MIYFIVQNIPDILRWKNICISALNHFAHLNLGLCLAEENLQPLFDTKAWKPSMQQIDSLGQNLGWFL